MARFATYKKERQGGFSMATHTHINYAPRNSDRLRTKKPVVNEMTPRDVIFHQGIVYEVPAPMLRYIESTESEDIRKRAATLGLTIDARGKHSCTFCKHNPCGLHSLPDVGLEDDLNTVMDTGAHIGPACQYSVGQTKMASVVTHGETDVKYMAQLLPCAATQAKIEVLVEKGHLDAYRVNKPFGYPTYHQLDTDPAARQRYRVSGPGVGFVVKARPPWWERLVTLFRKA
jgi:hypothetical protein